MKIFLLLTRKCLFDAIVSCDEMDIVIKESPSKIITMSCGEKMIKESALIKGEISNLQLSADGNKALYVIDNKIIELLDITTGIITKVLQVDKPIQFVKIINLLNRDIILCRWEDNNLKVCILNSFLSCILLFSFLFAYKCIFFYSLFIIL